MAMSSLGQHNIYYEQHGVGDDLVLIGGFTADHSVWSEMIGHLSQSYRVLIFDNPGVGRSFVPEGDYSLEAMSKDIASLLDHLEIDCANFIGHSMGAALLMQFCVEQPKRVNKAMLCGGTASIPVTAKLQVQGLCYALEHEFPDEYISLSILPWLYGRRFLNDTQRLEKLSTKLTENRYPQTWAGFHAQTQALLAFDISSRLREIKAECLIVASDEDLLIPMHCAHFLEKNIRNSSLEVIGEGVGHMFHIEEAQQLSQLALKFFKKR